MLEVLKLKIFWLFFFVGLIIRLYYGLKDLEKRKVKEPFTSKEEINFFVANVIKDIILIFIMSFITSFVININ